MAAQWWSRLVSTMSSEWRGRASFIRCTPTAYASSVLPPTRATRGLPSDDSRSGAAPSQLHQRACACAPTSCEKCATQQSRAVPPSRSAAVSRSGAARRSRGAQRSDTGRQLHEAHVRSAGRQLTQSAAPLPARSGVRNFPDSPVRSENRVSSISVETASFRWSTRGSSRRRSMPTACCSARSPIPTRSCTSCRRPCCA